MSKKSLGQNMIDAADDAISYHKKENEFDKARDGAADDAFGEAGNDLSNIDAWTEGADWAKDWLESRYELLLTIPETDND